METLNKPKKIFDSLTQQPDPRVLDNFRYAKDKFENPHDPHQEHPQDLLKKQVTEFEPPLIPPSTRDFMGQQAFRHDINALFQGVDTPNHAQLDSLWQAYRADSILLDTAFPHFVEAAFKSKNKQLAKILFVAWREEYQGPVASQQILAYHFMKGFENLGFEDGDLLEAYLVLLKKVPKPETTKISQLMNNWRKRERYDLMLLLWREFERFEIPIYNQWVGAMFVHAAFKTKNVTMALKFVSAIKSGRLQLYQYRSYSQLVTTLVEGGKHGTALDILVLLDKKKMNPDPSLYAQLLSVSDGLSMISVTRAIHKYWLQHKDTPYPEPEDASPELLERWKSLVPNALISSYTNCGSLEDAVSVWDGMSDDIKSCASYSVMIIAYSSFAKPKEAYQVFNQLLENKRLEPDSLIFKHILKALCDHEEFHPQAFQIYRGMQARHGISPTKDHQQSIVHIYTKSHDLEKAEELVRHIQKPDFGILFNLLFACQVDPEKEFPRAKRIFEIMLKVHPNDQGTSQHILMANICSKAGDDESAKKILESISNKKSFIGKTTLQTSDGKMKIFHSGTPQYDQILVDRVMTLHSELKQAGYVPDLTALNHVDMGDYPVDKESILCLHSERIAVTFALMSTPEGTPIRATNSVRICPDCHTALKWISKLKNRKILIRDHKYYHEFNGGECSCGDNNHHQHHLHGNNKSC